MVAMVHSMSRSTVLAINGGLVEHQVRGACIVHAVRAAPARKHSEPFRRSDAVVVSCVRRVERDTSGDVGPEAMAESLLEWLDGRPEIAAVEGRAQRGDPCAVL